MLSAAEIVESRAKPPPELPTLGIKDFEPNGSQEQSYQIEHSLEEISNLVSFKVVKSLNSLSQAIWRPELNLAEVTLQTGSHWASMGHKVEQRLYIYPEEALYLLETGAIEITFNGVPISIQRAYFLFFTKESSISIAKYRVYSLLKSQGYNVLRHSPKNTVTKYEKKLEVHKVGVKLKNYKHAKKKGKREFESEDQSSETKKIKVSQPKEFSVAYHDSDNSDIQLEQSSKAFDYDLYTDMLEKHSFKKSCLQLPTYRVVIHRGEDTIPNINSLCNLSDKYEDEIPVIHAVVFCDYIAFYQINSVTLPSLND